MNGQEFINLATSMVTKNTILGGRRMLRGIQTVTVNINL